MRRRVETGLKDETIFLSNGFTDLDRSFVVGELLDGTRGERDAESEEGRLERAMSVQLLQVIESKLARMRNPTPPLSVESSLARCLQLTL